MWCIWISENTQSIEISLFPILTSPQSFYAYPPQYPIWKLRQRKLVLFSTKYRIALALVEPLNISISTGTMM